MKDLAECLFVFGLIFGIWGTMLYINHVKFQRCIEYGNNPAYSEMFGESCKSFYK